MGVFGKHWNDDLPVDQIENAKALTSIFDGWPSFHDAEIHRVTLLRGSSGGPAVMEIAIHVYEITSDLTDMGYLALKNHTLATLRFHGARDIAIAQFGGRNSIHELPLRPDDDGWSLRLDSPQGEASPISLRCDRIEVVSVEPHTPDWPPPPVPAAQLHAWAKEQRRKRQEGTD